jgi:1-deoxy-D-xylulose-5-phosphate reductoisomerase
VQNGSEPHEGWSVGPQCLVDAVQRDDVDIVLNAVVGAVGLQATLAALSRGKRVALANKETLVMAGALVTAACAAGGGELVPVDSEHSAFCSASPAAEHGRSAGDHPASGEPFRNGRRNSSSRRRWRMLFATDVARAGIL